MVDTQEELEKLLLEKVRLEQINAQEHQTRLTHVMETFIPRLIVLLEEVGITSFEFSLTALDPHADSCRLKAWEELAAKHCFAGWTCDGVWSRDERYLILEKSVT